MGEGGIFIGRGGYYPFEGWRRSRSDLAVTTTDVDGGSRRKRRRRVFGTAPPTFGLDRGGGGSWRRSCIWIWIKTSDINARRRGREGGEVGRVGK